MSCVKNDERSAAMLERFTSLAIACGFYAAAFAFMYYIWLRPTPGFVGQPFWDTEKIKAAVVVALVLSLHVLFASGWRRRFLYSGLGSLAVIWFSELSPSPQGTRIFGFIYLYLWAACIVYGVLLG